MPQLRTLLAIACLSILFVPVPLPAGDDLATLIARLRDPDVDVRYDALFDLRDREQPTPEVVMALKGALADEDFGIRIAAAGAFLHVGGDIEAVEPLLADPDEYVQREIARLLVLDGRRLEPAVRWLLQQPVHGGTTESQKIFEAFSQQRGRQVASILLQALESAATPFEFFAARNALSAIDGLSAEHVPQLVGLLQHEDASRRACAAELLGVMADHGSKAIPALETCLGDSDEKVHVHAALTLLSFPSARERAIAELRHALQRWPSPNRFDAVVGLAWLESPPDELAPDLVKSLGSDDAFERVEAFRILAAIGPDFVPWLIAEVESADENASPHHRWVSIAEILGRFGQQAAASVPALLRLTRYDDADVQSAAAKALGSAGCGSDVAVARLAELTSHSSIEVRRAAAEGLVGAAGGDNKLREMACAALWSMSEDDIPHVRILTAAKLIILGEEPSRCLPVLESFLRAEDGKIVEAALSAFETLGPSAAQSIPALIAAFKTEACVPAGLSSLPLHGIVPRVVASVGSAAVPALMAALEDTDPQVRGHAAEALGLIGSEAAVAATALARRFRDRGQYAKTMGCMAYVQTVAEDALQAVAQIGPQAKGALPALAELIGREPVDTTEGSGIRSGISDALAAIGPDAAGAVPWLWDLATQDGDARCEAHALAAIARITPDDPRVLEHINELLLCIPQWDPMLESNSAETYLVLDLLCDCGAPASTLIPTLKYLMSEAPLLNREFRIRVAYALAYVDSNNDDAIEFLQRQSLIGPRRYQPPFNQYHARRLLQRLGEKKLLPPRRHE